jgi:hypothetical protein
MFFVLARDVRTVLNKVSGPLKSQRLPDPLLPRLATVPVIFMFGRFCPSATAVEVGPIRIPFAGSAAGTEESLEAVWLEAERREPSRCDSPPRVIAGLAPIRIKTPSMIEQKLP